MLGSYLREEFGRNLLTQIWPGWWPCRCSMRSSTASIHRRYNGAACSACAASWSKAMARPTASLSASRSSVPSTKRAAACCSTSPSGWRRQSRKSQRHDVIYSRIIGTGSYLPENVVTNADLASWSIRRTNGYSSAPASASATSPPTTRPPAIWRCEAAQRATRRGRHHGRPNRPDHRRHHDARHDLSEHRLHAAGQARHQGLPGLRRAGGLLRLRLCADIADQFIRTGSMSMRWWSAPKSFRAFSTGTTAAPACCSATAPARWCSAQRRARHPAGASACRRLPRRYPVGAGHGLRRQGQRRPVSADGRQRGVQVCGQGAGGSRAAKRSQPATCRQSDIDWLIPHQANIRIIEATAKKLGIDRWNGWS